MPCTGGKPRNQSASDESSKDVNALPYASLCAIRLETGEQIDGPGGRELRLGTPEEGNEKTGSIRQFGRNTMLRAKLTGAERLISSLPEALPPTLQKSSGAQPSSGPWLGTTKARIDPTNL